MFPAFDLHFLNMLMRNPKASNEYIQPTHTPLDLRAVHNPLFNYMSVTLFITILTSCFTLWFLSCLYVQFTSIGSFGLWEEIGAAGVKSSQTQKEHANSIQKLPRLQRALAYNSH